MNSLSWMIYSADFVGDLTVFAWLSFALGVLGSSFALGLQGIDDVKAAKPWVSRLLAIAALSAAIVIVTPSSNTIYAIAASEMGEDVLNSKTAGKAMKALDAWLDHQIDGKDEQ